MGQDLVVWVLKQVDTGMFSSGELHVSSEGNQTRATPDESIEQKLGSICILI